MLGRRIFSAAIAASLTTAAVAAQSLGDIARQEEARRASARKAVKTLSNADLDASVIAQQSGNAPAETSCYMSKSTGRCVTAAEMLATSVAGVVTKENAPFEQKWRNDATEIRSQVEKAQHSIATLEEAVADGGRSVSDRKALEKTLAATRQALARFERQWEVLEMTAGNEHIPRKWIEPIPTLTKNQPQQ
jgi:hypothetical protein